MIQFEDAEGWQLLNKQGRDDAEFKDIVLDVSSEADIDRVKKVISLSLSGARDVINGEKREVVDPVNDFVSYFSDFVSQNWERRIMISLCFAEEQKLIFGLKFDVLLTELYWGLLSSISGAIADGEADVREKMRNVHVWVYLI